MAKQTSKIPPIDKLLFQAKNDKLGILSRLKHSSLPEFGKQIRRAYKHPITKAYILGKHKPKSYAELRESKISHYSNHLEGEIAWVLESILLSKNEINEFVILESEIQKTILLGENQQAIEVLNKIESKICYSYWGLELRYFLIERLEGTEGNWKFNSQINTSTSNPFTLFFNQVFSKKAEQGVSCSDFHRSLHNEIRSASRHDFEYLNFKLAYHLLPDYSQYPFLVFADSSSSIIDRYISLINIIPELLSSDLESHNLLASNVLKDLGAICDDRIDRFMEFCGIKEIRVESPPFIEILELYTLGQYDKCISDIPELLRRTPNFVELWEIYVKSLIESSKPFVPTNISEHFDELIQKLFIAFSVEDSSVQKAEELLKLVLATPSLSYAKQLLALIGSMLGLYSNKNVINNNVCFHSTTTNPIIYMHSNSVSCDSDFEKLNTSQCIRLIAGYEVDENNLKSRIDPFKFNLYQLRKAYREKNYDKCIAIGKDLDILSIRNNIFVEEIYLILFHANSHTNQFDKAIHIFVSSFFLNKNLIKRINASSIIERIIDQNYPISGNIDSALFFNLNNLDYYHCFVTVEMWLESLNVYRPSEIPLPSDEQSIRKYLYILEYGCTIEVLEKFYYNYDSKEDVIEERKNILSILIQNDPSNSEKYINELSSTTHKEKVQSILHEVNSGRIRLTESMLESSNETNFQNNYDRYRLLSKFSENFDLESYDVKTLLKNYLEEFIDSKSLSSNPSFLSFKSLVNELIDSFLFNKKNGLDGELSTRIRHGELENQIRSVFDRKHLISKKDDSGEYAELTYWSNLFSKKIDVEKIVALQQILKNFSQKIDSIIQSLVKENIQVKSENYPDKNFAFFNYHFTDNYLKLLYEESRRTHDGFEQFVEYIYSILKVHTESNLKTVSEYLTNELRKIFDEEIDNLRVAITTIADNLVELNQSIIDTKVEFQNEILDISNWFVIADSTIETSMDVKTIIECSFESSNIQHPNTIINPIIEADDKLYIYNYKHYIFILINLIENIRLYSRLPNDDLEVVVRVSYEKNQLVFGVRNNFNLDQVDRSELISTFTNIKENWNKEVDQENVNKERGSGYEKIKKILTYHIKSRNNSFDFVVEEDKLEVIFSVEISFNIELDG